LDARRFGKLENRLVFDATWLDGTQKLGTTSVMVANLVATIFYLFTLIWLTP
jgi:hypothetical protein